MTIDQLASFVLGQQKVSAEAYYWWCTGLMIIIHVGFLMYEVGATRLPVALAGAAAEGSSRAGSGGPRSPWACRPNRDSRSTVSPNLRWRARLAHCSTPAGCSGSYSASCAGHSRFDC